MIRTAVPVTLRIVGRDGECVVFVRPLSAREEALHDRELRRSMALPEDEIELALVDLYARTVGPQIDRVESTSEDFPPFEGADPVQWADSLGREALGTLVRATVQRLDDGESDRLGKSTSGLHRPRLADSAATSAATTPEPSAGAPNPSLIQRYERSELPSERASWISRWLTGIGRLWRMASCWIRGRSLPTT